MATVSQPQRDLLQAFPTERIAFLTTEHNEALRIWLWKYEPEFGRLDHHDTNPTRVATVEALERHRILQEVPEAIAHRVDPPKRYSSYHKMYALTPEGTKVIRQLVGYVDYPLPACGSADEIEAATQRLESAAAALPLAVDRYLEATQSVKDYVERADHNPDWILLKGDELQRARLQQESPEALAQVASSARAALEQWVLARAAYFEAVAAERNARRAYIDLAPWLAPAGVAGPLAGA